MTPEEFYRKRLIQLAPTKFTRKLYELVDITIPVQIMTEYAEMKLQNQNNLIQPTDDIFQSRHI